jgi:hypothetical protein
MAATTMCSNTPEGPAALSFRVTERSLLAWPA